jgi:hypothetical protein
VELYLRYSIPFHGMEITDTLLPLVKSKVKVKSLCLTKHHTMKAYWGSGGIALRIVSPGTQIGAIPSARMRFALLIGRTA